MFPPNSDELHRLFAHKKWRLIAALALVFYCVPGSAQKSQPQKPVVPPLGMQIVSNGNEPELRVDGVPFFVHAAQFDYFRIPADLWYRSLDRYRELGINTIDLRIPWNWHELRDADFDFDGHSNPRRDLRTLLKLIAQKHLKLIVRPGPLIGDEWRNGGYPPWLLAYSNYKMSASAIQTGVAPPGADLATHDANAAARGWLANEIHMSYTRRWLTAVSRELAPYRAKNTIVITEPGEREGETQEKQISGPLLFVALDDALAIQPASESPDLARYLTELRGAMRRGGLDATSFVTAADVAGQGGGSLSMGTPEGDPTPVGLAGEWLFPSSAVRGSVQPASLGSSPARASFLTAEDASSLAFLANSLGTQPDFPPFLSGFAASTLAPRGDVRVVQPSTEGTLLASRLLVGNGIRGIVYAPLQDTLTPAGWETASAPRYFRWDSALDLAGNRGPRANGVSRNGQLISAWGAMLATSHLRADFGIVDLRSSSATADQVEIGRNALAVKAIFRVAELEGFTPEMVNPAVQPVERLLRNPVIMLPVPASNSGTVQLSEKAQAALVEFVQRGGVLVYFPSRPPGKTLEVLWQGEPAGPPAGTSIREWSFERGRIIASSSDFYSGISLAEDSDKAREQPDSSAAIETLASLLGRASVVHDLRRTGGAKDNANLVVSQLVSNEAPAPAGHPEACAEGQLCAAALVSVINIGSDPVASETLEMIDPRQSATGSAPQKLLLDVTVPAHESLLLPIHAPLCSAVSTGETCSDEVITAAAELLGADRDGKTLELTFYAPARAMVRLHLESAPSRVDLDDNIRLDENWKQETGELEVPVLRGAAPDYRRVLRIHLRYTPHVEEKPDPKKNGTNGSEYQVFDAIRFSLASDATIPSSPPLIAANPASGGGIVISSMNHSEDSRTSTFDIEGAFRGTGSARMFGNEVVFTRIRFQPTRTATSEDSSSPPATDGLLRGNLTIRTGRTHGGGPLLFVPTSENGSAHYQYDFDRDGSPEWVLESGRLRLIVSPADGGRALALMDKTTGDDLITLGGALHDFLVPAGANFPESLAAGDFSFNRSYRAAWSEEKQDASLLLTYQQYENSAAGLHVEKTLRLTAPETVETNYRVWIVAPPAPSTSGPAEVMQSFISTLTVPVPATEAGNTRFCWESPGEPHCEDFVSSGASISVPEGITRLRILTPGRNPLAVEWTVGTAVIVPREFSAEVYFVVPVPAPTEAPGEFSLRYTVESGK
jgi:hypothetical protein